MNAKPCLHPKTLVACMYDTVSHKYFYNQGTGEFIPAPRFLDYIQSDGNQYIDTEVLCSYDYTIKIKYAYTAFKSSYNCIFGARKEAQSVGNQIYWVGCNQVGKALMMRMGKTTSTYTLELNKTYELTVTPDEATINGTSLGDAMYDGEIGFSKSIRLFNINDVTPSLFASSARVCYFQVYDKDMNLIQDLRPSLDTKGVVCMYDMVTKKYFYNAGTGNLVGYKRMDIDYTRIFAYFASDNGENKWSYAYDSYSILIPVEIGKKYRLEWETTTTSDVGTIFRYGQTDIPKAEGQVLKNVVRTSPQTTPIADITAVDKYLVVQITSATANVVVDNKYLKAYEIL
jgi:hypothetical protein